MTVTDIERSMRFWRDALGTEVVLDQETSRPYLGEIVGEQGAHARAVHLAFRGGATLVELYQYFEPSGGSAELRVVDVGFAHVAVTCDDLDDLLRRLVEAGGRPFGDPVTIDAGTNAGARALYVRDPDGHTLELLEPARS